MLLSILVFVVIAAFAFRERNQVNRSRQMRQLRFENWLYSHGIHPDQRPWLFGKDGRRL